MELTFARASEPRASALTLGGLRTDSPQSRLTAEDHSLDFGTCGKGKIRVHQAILYYVLKQLGRVPPLPRSRRRLVGCVISTAMQ